MKFFNGLMLLLAVVLLASACKKDIDDNKVNPDPESVQDLIIPEGFEWENSQNVELTVNVESDRIYQPLHKISVFRGDPAAEGQMIASGSAGPDDSFVTTIAVPAYQQNLFLLAEGPFGSYELVEVPVESGVVSYTFSNSKSAAIPNNGMYKNSDDGPNCTEGCDEYISGSGSATIKDGKTYCIAESFSGSLNYQSWSGGGTVRICGTATITNYLSLGDNCNLVVAEDASATFTSNVQFGGGDLTIYQNAEVNFKDISVGSQSNITIYENADVSANSVSGWNSSSLFINYGNLSVDGDMTFSFVLQNWSSILVSGKMELNATTFKNYGSIDVEGNFASNSSNAVMHNYGDIISGAKIEINNNCVLNNEGSIQADYSFNMNASSSLENQGAVITGEALNFSTSGIITNYCKMIAGTEINFNNNSNLVMDAGFIKAATEFNFWTQNNVELTGQCMISAAEMNLQCSIVGSGDLNSVVVTGDLNVNSSQDKFDGQIEVVTTSGGLAFGGEGNFANGAYITNFDNAQNYLPVTACNPDGFGSPTIVDTDNDGVPDESDDYPLDPLRAFNNYFPDDEDHATIAFEDLWPGIGDYDFNDLVVSAYGYQVSNADDDLVDIYINFKVLAVGASLDNGFGFQLETITPDQITSVSGMVLEQGYVNLNANGSEAGQTKAVVIVAESVNDVIQRPGGSFFNTVQGNPTGSSEVVAIEIHFAEPVEHENFGPQVYNPFIIKNQERSVEIHLPYYPPTDLMDTSLFGTVADASDPDNGVYYVTRENLPWGMMMLEAFDYPVENSQIIDAYNFFADWAQSGGAQYPDWYLNENGYRNSSKIYVPNE